MAEPLKNRYNQEFFDTFSNTLAKAVKGVDKKRFIKQIFNKEWDGLELKQRMRHVALVLHNFLDKDFSIASKQIIALTDILLDGKEGKMDFLHMFLPDYVELYGIDDYENSMSTLEKVTQFASAEFAIRPFIIKYPQTMEQMLAWSKHKSPFVRRLSSEGSRPRLPWAIALPEFKKDPSPIIPILENLKQDEAETVRRSVANNLNDIAKDNPEVVLEIVKRWQGKSKNTDWIIKHGSRTLLKQGHTTALNTFDLNENVKVKVEGMKVTPSTIKIGDATTLNFTLILKEKKETKLRVEYAVYYVKANGSTGKKVFKITENTYPPNKPIEFERTLRFHDLTTRKHYAGIHKITAVINGKAHSSTKLDLKE